MGTPAGNSRMAGTPGAPLPPATGKFAQCVSSSALSLFADEDDKPGTLACCLAVFGYSVALATESRHAAIVDMPAVATLSHASPDTWDILPPVQPNEWQASKADAPTGHALDGFAQLHRHGLGTELAFGGVFVLPMTLTLHSFLIV